MRRFIAFSAARSKAALQAEARQWLLRIQTGHCTRAEWDVFENWMDSDTRCRATYLQVEQESRQVLRRIRRVHTAGLLDDDSWLQPRRSARALSTVLRAARPLWLLVCSWTSSRIWGVIGSVVMVTVLGTLLMRVPVRHVASAPTTNLYSTKIGEIRTVNLQEGTLTLNTRTQVRYEPSDSRNVLVLLQGEILLNVTHDESQKPLKVLVDNTEITDVGTEFSVYRKANGAVTVTVSEGAVRILNRSGQGWSRLLNANQQIEYNIEGITVDTHLVTSDATISWRYGYLTFVGTPLPTILEELNRYSSKRIVIGDPQLRRYRFTGALDAHDIPEDLAILGSSEIDYSSDAHTIYLGRRLTDSHPDRSSASTPPRLLSR